MFYRQLAEVSAYVADQKYQLNEMLRLLCLRAMSQLNVEALIFTELDALGTAHPNHFFGYEIVDKNGNTPKFLISEKTPFTDCIRENKIIWIDSLPGWPKQYSMMAALSVPKQYKTMIACPVESRGFPIGSLSIFSRSKLEYDESIAQFIEAISMILANTIDVNKKSTYDKSPDFQGRTSPNAITEEIDLVLHDYREPLTERQNLILKLISEGRTNAAIADVLGYSESLIRQETIRIYAKLGCSGRNEASQIYIRSNSKESNHVA